MGFTIIYIFYITEILIFLLNEMSFLVSQTFVFQAFVKLLFDFWSHWKHIQSE